MDMKTKSLLIMLSLALVTLTMASCMGSSSNANATGGELTGVRGTAYSEPTPYGMVAVHKGSLRVGIEELNFYNQQYCGCEYSMRKENTVVMYPPAKINLGLNVLRKREDGFHDIETLFYAVPSLCDRLEVSKSDEIRADVEGLLS